MKFKVDDEVKIVLNSNMPINMNSDAVRLKGWVGKISTIWQDNSVWVLVPGEDYIVVVPLSCLCHISRAEYKQGEINQLCAHDL